MRNDGLRVMLVVAVFIASASPVTAKPSSCVWDTTYQPLTGGLGDVSALSPTLAWAVGWYHPKLVDIALTERWDGTIWRQIASPRVPDVLSSGLNSVSMVSPSDVWAVGSSVWAVASPGFPTDDLTLIEHWNGSAWSLVAGPTFSGSADLFSVAKNSSSDIWAVGSARAVDGRFRTLVEHWNGAQWSVVPSPNVAQVDNYLQWVSVASQNDVWAVGTTIPSPGSLDTSSLIEHWNGSQWSIVPSPNGPHHTVLYGVKALSSNVAWAVGQYATDPGGYPVFPLAELWNGSTWTIVPTPNVLGGQLFSAAATSPQDVWAAGYVRYRQKPGRYVLVEHWDGTAWSIVSKPDVFTLINLYVFGMDEISPTKLLIVSPLFDNNGTVHPVTEHYHC